MTARVLLVVIASWCLVSVALGLTFCQAVIWARGADDDETAVMPQPAGAEQVRPAVALPSPRSHDVVVDLTALDEVAAAASTEQPGRALEP